MLNIKNLLPSTLFGRSLLIILLPVILLQVILLTVFLDNHFRKMTSRYTESVAGEIAFIVDDLNRGRPFEDLQTKAQSHLEMHLEQVSKSDYDNVVSPVKGLWERWVSKSLKTVLQENLNYPFRIIYNNDAGFVKVFINGDGNYLRVTFPERKIFTSSSYIFLVWMVGSSLFLSFIALWFMRNQVRPIRRLSVAAERLGRGLDVATFKPTGSREVRQASQAFLVMKERLQKQIEQRTTMLAGISHDLRTPLTRLKLSLSMLDKSEDIKDMQHDVNEMEQMIKGYLDFVRGEGDETVKRVKLNEYLNNLCQDQRLDSVAFVDKTGEDIYYSLRPLAMERAITNIIVNAGRYGDKTVLTLAREGEWLVITIEDNGAGIPEEKFEEVFRPFYRLDEARSADTGGVGLGLTIAQEIVLAHGGEIKLSKSEDLGGLKADIYMPS